MEALLMLLAHLVGDYFLQTNQEATNKALGKWYNRHIVSHSLKYTLCFLPVFWHLHIDYLWLAFIFVTHLVVDRRWLIIGFRKLLKHESEEAIAKTFWITIMLDQTVHLAVIVIVLACV
jgi:hypothetical protein